MTDRTRGYAHRVDVKRPVSAVWAALTTPAALREWWSPGAEIDARPGGSVRASVDRVTEFVAHIDVCLPERRLRLIHLPSQQLPSRDCTLVDDIVLEAGAQAAIVRLLGSGVPGGSGWDALYLRMRRGWEQTLARLKVYVEREGVQRAR